MATTKARSRTASHRLSTSEYHLPVKADSAPKWNYAYANGVGADRGKRPSYPVNTKRRAKAARNFAARSNTAGSLRTVDAAIRHNFGSVGAIYRRSARS